MCAFGGAVIVVGVYCVGDEQARMNRSIDLGPRDCGDVPDYGSERRRVALCFYGLNRSLRYTINSIHRHIFGPLFDGCVQWDVFAHTYSETTITSPHAGEFQSPIGGSKEMTELLRPHRFTVTHQMDTDEELDIRVYTGRGFAYVNVTQRNLLRQLKSLQLVTALWTPHATMYRSVAYVRPDLLFTTPLDVIAMIGAREGELYAPYWHRHLGENDRFVFGAPSAAAIWGNRLVEAAVYAKRHRLISEPFLAWVLAKHNLRVRYTSMIAMRVRSGGEIYGLDACLASRCRWTDRKCHFGCHATQRKKKRQQLINSEVVA